jgi:peptide-methionine (S)-S-oxide reductase
MKKEKAILMKNVIVTLALSLCLGCHNNAQVNPKQQAVIDADPVVVPMENGLARAYFASGCFWCVEAIYESVKGVEEVISGYSGGFTENPTYEASNTGKNRACRGGRGYL